MATKQFTVILIPDEDGYQVFVPHFPSCTTWGETPEQALAHAKEAMELLLEEPGVFEKDVLDLPSKFHVTVGEVDVEVPDAVLVGAGADTSETVAAGR
jgi:predicted RNase H-like HicB family nuclease